MSLKSIRTVGSAEHLVQTPGDPDRADRLGAHAPTSFFESIPNTGIEEHCTALRPIKGWVSVENHLTEKNYK